MIAQLAHDVVEQTALAGCVISGGEVSSGVTSPAQARDGESTGFAVLDQAFRASPMTRRAVFVAGVALLASLELGVFCSGEALLFEGALALVFFSFVFGLASVARHSKVVLSLMPWLLWPMALVVAAAVLTVVTSVLLEWPLTVTILAICRS
jgi:hypothetical protein